MVADPVIEFDGVSFGFESDSLLFEEVSLGFAPGAFSLVTGPSGVGKSTLLRLINRLEEPTAGEIRFQGRPLHLHAPPRLRRSILSVQQMPTAIDASVRDNLLLPFGFAANADLSRPDDAALERQLAEVLMEDVSLEAHAQTLSVGQLQRLSILRGLQLQPEVMLLDEPTSALDHDSRDAVLALIARIYADTGMTTVMVSHQDVCPPGVAPSLLRVRDRRVERVEPVEMEA
jgi:putative ABC transport system ATP-binding protein